MKVSNRTNLAAGIILLLLAAFFSIALLLQPLDFGQFGPGKANFLFQLGEMLTSVYGFTSILIPVFLFTAAISCFASNWTARKSMRLLTAAFPFFTSFAAEKLIKFFLAENGGNFIGLKIAVTLILAAMLIAIEFLVAGIVADRISTGGNSKKSENSSKNFAESFSENNAKNNKETSESFKETKAYLKETENKASAESESFDESFEESYADGEKKPKNGFSRIKNWFASKFGKSDKNPEEDDEFSFSDESNRSDESLSDSKENIFADDKSVFDTEESISVDEPDNLNVYSDSGISAGFAGSETSEYSDASEYSEDSKNPNGIKVSQEELHIEELPDFDDSNEFSGASGSNDFYGSAKTDNLSDLENSFSSKKSDSGKNDSDKTDSYNEENPFEDVFANIKIPENSNHDETSGADENPYDYKIEAFGKNSKETSENFAENANKSADSAGSSNVNQSSVITQEEFAALTGFDDEAENDSDSEEKDEIEWPDAEEIKAKAGNANGDFSDFEDEFEFEPKREKLYDKNKKNAEDDSGFEVTDGLDSDDEDAEDEQEIAIFGQSNSEKDDTITLDSDFEDSFNKYENLVKENPESDDDNFPETEISFSETEIGFAEPKDTFSGSESENRFEEEAENVSENSENRFEEEIETVSENSENRFEESEDNFEETENISEESENYYSASDVLKSQLQEKKSSLSSEIFDDMEDEIRKEVKSEMLQKKYGIQSNVSASENASGASDSSGTSFQSTSQNSSAQNSEFFSKTTEIPETKSHRATQKKPYSVPTELLEQYSDDQYWIVDDETKHNAVKLTDTLTDFGISAEVIGIKKGPVVTMYELEPAPGVRLSKIVSLQDNIALSLAASSVRIVAPIPGRAAVGIEVPNKKRSIVSFREMIEQDLPEFKKMAIPVVLGKDILGKSQIIDIAKTPHLLIAGATGAGKSVCVNSIILSILYKRSPQQVKMILVDPKVVELKLYNDIPHLLTPVITDPKRALQSLQWCLCEMERRYAQLDSMGVRDIASYNNRIEERKICTEKLPYIVIIIDEFADLMATSGKELESNVARLAAMSRAVGIHLVLATQRPSVNVITGLIKANIPSRIAFMVASRTDSNIIIDAVGAEKLLGKGDMLYASAISPYPVRIQGTFESDSDVENVVDYVKTLGEPDYIDDQMFFDDEEDDNSPTLFSEGAEDPLYEQALDIVIQAGKASASYIQRRLKIGYNRAARLVEEMEERGIVGPANGSKPREIIHVPS